MIYMPAFVVPNKRTHMTGKCLNKNFAWNKTRILDLL